MAAGRADVALDRVCPKCERVPDGPDALCPACGCRLVELAPDLGLTGTIVDGRFEIRDVLGEGGMGTVYRAWQRSVGREIAVKVIDRKKVRDGMAVRRFLREARLASQLSHPNTVHVIDFGQAEDRRLFIAMELVRGRTLAEVVAQDGGLGLARAVGIGMQLCDALEAAHGLAIVHRDLKPANVILADEPVGRDRIKVLDFGLAKSLTAEDTESTQTGDVVGTPRYLAPELAMGEAATPQSDLYAVGVMLVELCTGRRLFDATRMVDLMMQKSVDPQVPPEVPPALAALVARLIDPDPVRRPPSASALRTQLAACLVGGDAAAGTGARAAAPHEPTRATGPVRFGAPRAPSPTMTSTPSAIAAAVPAPAAVTHVPPAIRRRRWPWIAGALGGIGAFAAAIGLSAGRARGPEAAAPTPPAAATPAAPATIPTDAPDGPAAAAASAIDAGATTPAPPPATATIPGDRRRPPRPDRRRAATPPRAKASPAKPSPAKPAPAKPAPPPAKGTGADTVEEFPF